MPGFWNRRNRWRLRYPEDSLRGRSSVGRALPLQGRCQGFDSPRLHPRTVIGPGRLEGCWTATEHRDPRDVRDGSAWSKRAVGVGDDALSSSGHAQKAFDVRFWACPIRSVDSQTAVVEGAARLRSPPFAAVLNPSLDSPGSALSRRSVKLCRWQALARCSAPAIPARFSVCRRPLSTICTAPTSS